MEKLECIIVHRSMPLVSSFPDDLYYLSDVRDGEIVHKRSRLLKPFKHAVVRVRVRCSLFQRRSLLCNA